MDKLYRTFHLINAISFLVFGWLIIWFIMSRYSLTNTFFLPLFPFFFWGWSWVNNFIIKKNYSKDPKRIASIYMLLKLIKNLLSGTVVLVLFMNFPTERTKLLMAFGAFYLLNLVLETVFLSFVEKQKKKEVAAK